MNRVRATAKRMRWTLTDAAELAFKLFLEEFENAKTISVIAVEKDSEPDPLPLTETVEAPAEVVR